MVVNGGLIRILHAWRAPIDESRRMLEGGVRFLFKASGPAVLVIIQSRHEWQICISLESFDKLIVSFFPHQQVEAIWLTSSARGRHFPAFYSFVWDKLDGSDLLEAGNPMEFWNPIINEESG